MGHFNDDLHALRTGFLLGTLMRAGIDCNPHTDDEGNYLPVVTIRLPEAVAGIPPIEVNIQVLPPE